MIRAIAAMTLTLGATMAQAADANPLEAERWQTRPLIVVVPEQDDPTLANLQRDLAVPANREAFVEREMVLFTVVNGVARRNDKPLDAAASAALLRAVKHDAQGPGRVILVGKDGGIKVDEQGPVDPKAVFATIDRMPMRQTP